MRIIHTADWHLGRQFHGASLIEDQACVLEDLCRLIRDQQADALIIAGDIYDRRQPPDNAVQLLDETLSEVILGTDTTVLMIAGNHDSGKRIAFGSSLLAERKLHVAGTVSAALHPVTLTDRYGEVDFCLLPYEQGEPLAVRSETGDGTIRSFEQAMAWAVDDMLGHCRSARRVAVAHCFAAGGNVSDSERPLSVGGSDQVSPELFAPFNYAALGHLHRPQRVTDQTAYSGSLLKYSFSEATHRKSVSVIDLDAQGQISCELITLRTRRDLRIVEGLLADLLSSTESSGSDDYILARLLDTGALYDPLARLRERFPNITHIERPNLFHNAASTGQLTRQTLKRTDQDIFSDFYETVTDNDLTEEERKLFQTSLESYSDSEAS